LFTAWPVIDGRASAWSNAKALSQNNLSNFVYPVTFYTLGDIV